QIFAECILIRPVVSRGGLADDDDWLRSSAIAGIEVTAGDERNPERRKVAGLDDVAGRIKIVPVSVDARHSKPETHLLESTRRNPGERGVLNAGLRADTIQQLTPEQPFGRGRIARGRYVDRRQLDAGRIETRIDGAGVGERAHEESCADDERDAEG